MLGCFSQITARAGGKSQTVIILRVLVLFLSLDWPASTLCHADIYPAVMLTVARRQLASPGYAG